VITNTNKRYSYPRVTAIQIDVHLVGENPINTPHAFHARFAYGPGPHISHGPRRQPFASPHKDETYPYTQKKSWWPKTNCPIVALDHLILPPSGQPWSRGERLQPSGYTATSVYWAHNTPACDRYVEYSLTGANPSVLNRYRRMLQP
jgi:hypothetical protein